MKPWAIGDLVIGDEWQTSEGSWYSLLRDSLGLPRVNILQGPRYGAWPIFSGLDRPGRTITLETRFMAADATRDLDRVQLFNALNPEDEDPVQAVLRLKITGRDRRVVEETEPHRGVAQRVMPGGPHGGEGGYDVPRGDGVRRGEAGTRGQQRDLEGALQGAPGISETVMVVQVTEIGIQARFLPLPRLSLCARRAGQQAGSRGTAG